MKYTELLDDISFWTGADHSFGTTYASFVDYTQTERTLGINQWYHKVISWILAAQDEWEWDDTTSGTDYPIATTNLTAGVQDYRFPVNLNILKIKRVEVTFDGTTWQVANPFDINETGNPTDATSISENFSTTEPFYDMEGNSIFLYPIPTANVTNGLKIWFYRQGVEFATSDTTREPGIDKPWHRLLSMGASLDYAIAKNLPNLIETLKALIDEQEEKLKAYYGSKQQQRRAVLGSIYGTDYGT